MRGGDADVSHSSGPYLLTLQILHQNPIKSTSLMSQMVEIIDVNYVKRRWGISSFQRSQQESDSTIITQRRNGGYTTVKDPRPTYVVRGIISERAVLAQALYIAQLEQ